jgi:photosystem II stability/assembly factor-like uncharacterized protein
MLFLLACQAPEPPPRLTPPPTEHRLGPGAEKRSNAGRREWFRQLHRAPFSEDWEALERKNGLAQLERRKKLPPPGIPRWIEHGSSNQAGRTHVTRLSEDGSSLYIGSANGGLWKGTINGEDYVPLGDATYGGVHFLEVIGDTLITASEGGIVLRSTDAGASWESINLGAWWVRRLAKGQDNTLYILTAGESGIFLWRSQDSGASWEEIANLDGIYGDFFVTRTGQDAIYLLNGSSLLSSTDSGTSWEEAGIAPAESSAWDLTGSELGAPAFYAIGDGSMLYYSQDAGLSWENKGKLDDFWSGSQTTSLVHPDWFFYGGVEFHRSVDQGSSFSIQNYWWEYYDFPAERLHADIQGIDVFLDEQLGEVWYINTDGGTYVSSDGLASVQNLSLYGLRIGQYYDVLTSHADPTHVAIGAQDQGYQLINDIAQADDLWEADQVLSGDYGQLTSGDGTHGLVYSVYPGFILIQEGESNPNLYYADFPRGENYVPWLPPIVADPTEPSAFFFPASRLYRYTRNRNTWQPELWSEQNFAVAAGEYISRLAFSPINPDYAWALTSYGRAWYSTDQGISWTLSPTLVADENWYYGQAIAPSRADINTVTIGGSGYGVPAVYRSSDGGKSWKPWSEGLPDTLVYSLVETSDLSGTVVAGTQTSAWLRKPGDAEWLDITDAQAPITIYWDAEALPDANTIRFATYGRGVWDYQLDTEGSDCFPGKDQDQDGSDCVQDCNDQDPTIFPGAEDPCDGIDQNCDPTSPEEHDADADGALACKDCDDRDPVRYPGAVELCGDGIDEDCNNQDPDCAPLSQRDCGCSSTGELSGFLGILALILVGRRRCS